jgi:hypothetical protein
MDKKTMDEEAVGNSVDDSINEYYKLKSKYENANLKNKKKILNNNDLSLKDKKAEYKKLVNKCINCKRPGGTIFTTKYNDELRTRELNAVCGVVADPCYLDIKIHAGYFENISDVLKEMENNIKEAKNKVIDDKNKLLFGFITTEQALSRFSEIKTEISDYASLLEFYINKYANITDNKSTKQKINDESQRSYELITQIKESIRNFNESGNEQFISDAVDVYVNSLKPILNNLMQLKYKSSFVFYNDDDNTHNLVQKKYDHFDLLDDLTPPKVVNFDYGIETKKKEMRLSEEPIEEDTNESEDANELEDKDTNAKRIGYYPVTDHKGNIKSLKPLMI